MTLVWLERVGFGHTADQLLESVGSGHAAEQVARAHVHEDAAGSDANHCEPVFERRRIIHTHRSMSDCLRARR